MKFSKAEQNLLEGQIQPAIEKISSKVEEIFEKLRIQGYDPQIRLVEIASQENWDRKSYGGDCKGLHFFLEDGLSEDAITNMMHTLGYPHSTEKTLEENIFLGILLKKAMRHDTKVDLLVKTIISGMEECRGTYKKVEYPILFVIGHIDDD